MSRSVSDQLSHALPTLCPRFAHTLPTPKNSENTDEYLDLNNYWLISQPYRPHFGFFSTCSSVGGEGSGGKNAQFFHFACAGTGVSDSTVGKTWADRGQTAGKPWANICSRDPPAPGAAHHQRFTTA